MVCRASEIGGLARDPNPGGRYALDDAVLVETCVGMEATSYASAAI
jgi:hypothetical protein